MTTYVIDASIAVKWALKEDFRPEAKRYLQSELSIIAPDFIVYECSSAVQKKVWQNEISEQAAWRAYDAIFEDNNLQLFATKPLIQPAFRLAVQLNHSIYDCYYLALAIQENAVVVTADRKFYDKAANSVYHHHIQWIETPPNVEA